MCRVRSAKVEDFVVALRDLHQQFHWPLPILSPAAYQQLKHSVGGRNVVCPCMCMVSVCVCTYGVCVYMCMVSVCVCVRMVCVCACVYGVCVCVYAWCVYEHVYGECVCVYVWCVYVHVCVCLCMCMLFIWTRQDSVQIFGIYIYTSSFDKATDEQTVIQQEN